MIIIVHGGAGEKAPSKRALKILSGSIAAGYATLLRGGPALDAVIVAISFLEDSGAFNAGSGGNVQLDGVRRLDASLMNGKDLEAGSVIGLEGIRNPIRAARLMMALPHVMMTDAGARRIAAAHGLEPIRPPGRREVSRLKKAKDSPVFRDFEKLFSTVGAVAMDRAGDVAAGASTGGVSAMLPGRVGDSPIIGAGIYAENGYGAVSCTGLGESILRIVLAKEICMRMKSSGVSTAVRSSLKRLLAIGGSAGVIVIDPKGRPLLMHTTERMVSGYADRKGIRIAERWKRVR